MKRLKTYWKSSKEGMNYFVEITENKVQVYENDGRSGHSEMGSACTHQEFLDGEYNQLVLNHHGGKALEEVLRTIKTIQNKET